MIHVSLIEDDDQTRGAWTLLLNGTPGFRCVSAHRTAEDALKHLPVERADVVMADLSLPGISGVELIRRLKLRREKLLLCVFTVHEDAEKVFESLRAGASGYILKKTPPAQVFELLSELVSGGAPMSPAIARKVAHFFHKLPVSSQQMDELTDREREILHHVAQGLMDKQIAARLGISTHTVRNHVRRIYDKLQVHSRTQATTKYLAR